MELSRDGGAKLIFESDLEDGIIVVRLEGELDLSNADALRNELEKLFSQSPKYLIFELQALSFFDSSGIAVLVEATKRVPTIALHKPSALIQQILVTTGLAQIFRILP